MHLDGIGIRDVRNLVHVELPLSPGLNVFCGANASGKTSLLEAVHLLSRGRSFRTSRLDDVIRHTAEALRVAGRVVYPQRSPVSLGIRRSRTETEIRVGGYPANSFAELSVHMPLQIIQPDSHELIEQGPRFRRRFLDWGVFHVEPAYHPVWQRYQRALRQRNAALRAGSSAPAVAAWHQELDEAAERMDDLRRGYLQRLNALLPRYVQEILGDCALQLGYLRGWPEGTGLRELLERALPREREVGHTRYGPHRADLALEIEGRKARDCLSRGQQKALVAALLVAQVVCYREVTAETCLFLIDDLPSELDDEHRGRLLQALHSLGLQMLVTAIDPGMLAYEFWTPRALFHVERGTFRPMV